MTRIKVLGVFLLAALLPLRAVIAQTEGSFPEMDVLRAWLQTHHPQLISGDSALNAAVVVVDTNGHYVKSTAFRLSASELEAWGGGVERNVSFQDDTVSKNLVDACIKSRTERPPVNAVCILDGARVPAVDGLRFLASRDVEVLRGEAASKRFGPDAAKGAVLVTTDTIAAARFASVGATSANFVAFEGRRIRRRADGAPVVITILMLRGTSNGAER